MNLINTNIHLSDMAVTIEVDPSNSEMPSTVNNIQLFAEMFNKVSVNGIENATTKTYGLARLSTLESDGSDVITTKRFIEKSLMIRASENDVGVVKLTEMDGNNIHGSDFVVDTKTYSEYIDATKSDISVYGVSKYTKDVMDTSSKLLISPKDLKYMIDTLAPKGDPATTTEYGLVKIVSVDTLYGIGKGYGDGYSISPRVFSESKASESRSGITRTTNNWKDSSIRSINTKALSSFRNETGTLIEEYKDLLNKFNELKKSYSYDIDRIARDLIEKKKTDMINSIIGVGDIIITGNNKSSVNVAVLDGRSLSVSGHRELFSIIGYKFGGSGNNFNIPDARGLFLKISGKSSLINGPKGNIRSYNSGDFLQPTVPPHKHACFGYASGADYMTGLWGTGMTKNGNYHGSRSLNDNCVLRYSNQGFEEGGLGDTGENRPWNFSISYSMRIK